MALTEAKNINRRSAVQFAFGVTATTKIHKGAIVALNAGNAVPASTATGLKIVGIAEETADNSTGIAGEVSVKVQRGCFYLKNDGDIDATHIGSTAYVVDDEAVAATDGGGTRSEAGTIRDVDADGVWVEI